MSAPLDLQQCLPAAVKSNFILPGGMRGSGRNGWPSSWLANDSQKDPAMLIGIFRPHGWSIRMYISMATFKRCTDPMSPNLESWARLVRNRAEGNALSDKSYDTFKTTGNILSESWTGKAKQKGRLRSVVICRLLLVCSNAKRSWLLRGRFDSRRSWLSIFTTSTRNDD